MELTPKMLYLLLLAIATLVSLSASAASPTATLSVRIAAPSAGIACDIGPNYTGSIPAGAAAAGFTHCAANWDFSSAQYANPATWLDICGASNPQWYADKSDGAGIEAPCSAWAIVSDGGTQVLQMHWQPSYYSSSIFTTGMTSKKGASGQDFPMGSYYQATYRNSVGSFSNPEDHNSPFVRAWWSWQTTAPGVNVIEMDFDETYAFSASTGNPLCGTVTCGAGGTWHDWNDGSANGISPLAGVAGFDPTAYITMGTRVTSNGSTTIAPCNYVNGTFVACGSISPGDSRQYQNRSLLIVYDGPQAQDGYSSAPVTDLFVKSAQVFTCNNWQTGLCLVNPVLTTAP